MWQENTYDMIQLKNEVNYAVTDTSDRIITDVIILKMLYFLLSTCLKCS